MTSPVTSYPVIVPLFASRVTVYVSSPLVNTVTEATVSPSLAAAFALSSSA